MKRYGRAAPPRKASPKTPASPRRASPKTPTSPRRASPKTPIRSPGRNCPTDDFEGDMIDLYMKREIANKISYDFMANSKHINSKMRTFLVKWLVEVTEEFKQSVKTLHLAVYILDKYISLNPNILTTNLQRLGITSMLIASKFEEVTHMTTEDCSYISDSAFSKQQIVQMEKEILAFLQYDVCVPTSIDFSDFYCDMLKFNKKERDMVNYILDSSLLHINIYNMSYSYRAAIAVFYVLFYFRENSCGTTWAKKLEKISKYRCDDIINEFFIVKEWLNDNKEVKTTYSRKSKSSVVKYFEGGIISPDKPSPKKLSPKKSSPVKTSPGKDSPDRIIEMAEGTILYSESYAADDGYMYRHVILPRSAVIPRGKLLNEREWRALGVQQSKGWVNYSSHRPEPHILLFRKPL